jgi:hypothetical protein
MILSMHKTHLREFLDFAIQLPTQLQQSNDKK